MAKRKRNQSPWTAAEIALLGVESDTALSKLIGRSEGCIRNKRGKLDIPMAGSASRVSWGPTELAFLRYDYSNRTIAKLTGRSISEVKAKRAELAKG